MTRLRDDRGATLVMVVFLFGVFLGAMALVIDLGSWFAAQRNVQAAADASVLAGAQKLPDTTAARSTAVTYANNNASNLTSPGFTSPTPTFPDTSTIDIVLQKKVRDYFAHVLPKHITFATVSAHARAIVGSPGTAQNALPIGIKSSAVCATGSTGCFGVAKTLVFDDTNTVTFGSNSTFGLLDFQPSDVGTTSSNCRGNVGEGTQAGWISGGFSGTLSINRYYGATTGQRTSIRNALNGIIGKTLLVPVFDVANSTWCSGAGGFHVVGWAAWVIDTTIPNSDWNPHNKVLHGHFVTYIAHDVTLVPGAGAFGIRVIKLAQ
jgi:putative Flp pilus-assembly TadE/G-like protein